jgi:putative peptide zinc metalloprotease protein
VVDLGGLYFNAIAAVAVMAVWLVVRVDALLLVVAAQLLLMLRQLPPVIRADGYHILSDLVGVPDLFQHIKPTLAGMLPWNRRRPQPLRPWARWTVRAWVVLVVPLLLWMFVLAVLFLPRLAATAWLGAQQQARVIAGASADADILGMAAGVLKMFALLLPVAASTFMIWRVVRRGWRSVWRRTEGRPAARRALALLTAVVLAALAVAWWPSGQYRPVRADERLTLQHLLSLRPVVEPTAKGIPGVRPVTGYALVPRNADAPAMLVVPGADGPQGILTGGPGVPSEAGGELAIATEGSRAGVAFPFKLPAAPGPGDNQALAVNATDGSVVYDVAVALVWVKDGSPVLNRNEAYALASCSYCTTVAVAFQVVLVVGQTDVVAPVNVAVALNGGCLECQTAALAVQLVVTLREIPTEDLQQQIEAAMAKLDDPYALPDIYAAVKEVEQEIITLLADAGLVDGLEQETSSTSSSGTSATTSTTVAASTSSTIEPESTTTTTIEPGPTTTTTGGESPTTTEAELTTTTSTTTPTTITTSTTSTTSSF